eukprot:TRINITY_DN57142_c0_g1_i1.p1 TRINITY_DN57142_c0_g1~~TRINITY_DN57142_c0_g1_i1.p1  ORF type:complete len:576 (+),score=145.42 TRINITY_DN57142_c0_g1_i1:79-1728(+)
MPSTGDTRRRKQGSAAGGAGGRQRHAQRGSASSITPRQLAVAAALALAFATVAGLVTIALRDPPLPPSPPTDPKAARDDAPGGGFARGRDGIEAELLRPAAAPLLKFSDWAWDRKIRMDGLIPRWRATHGWGLFAKRPLADMVLLAVPPWAMLTEDDVIGQPPPDGGAAWPRAALADAAQSAGLSGDGVPTFLLVLRLLTLLHPPAGHQHAEKGAEFWGPYIGVLPSPHSSGPFELPLFMGDSEAARCLSKDANVRRGVLRTELRQVHAAARHPGLWSSAAPPFSDSEADWAYAVVHTRCMSLPAAQQTGMREKAVCVPAGDLFNQDFVAPNAEWGLNATHGLIATTRPGVEIPKGEQVYIDYRSGRSAMDTVERYGYRPERGYPRLPAQIGLPIEGPDQLLREARPKCEVPAELWVDAASGEPSERLVWCSALALLPHRPEAWLYAQGKLPEPLAASVNISAHRHVLKVLLHSRGQIEPGEECQTAAGRVAQAASRLLVGDVDAASAGLRARIGRLLRHFDALPRRDAGVQLYHTPAQPDELEAADKH